tara:strand:+ start:112 stop:348 length:237 start_codon:yes stop_codon:yes gene_type:complete
MKWHEAKTWEEFNALPRKEREKKPGYLKCRMLVAKSFYDPFNDKVLSKLDQLEHEAINVRTGSPSQTVVTSQLINRRE